MLDSFGFMVVWSVFFEPLMGCTSSHHPVIKWLPGNQGGEVFSKILALFDVSGQLYDLTSWGL